MHDFMISNSKNSKRWRLEHFNSHFANDGRISFWNFDEVFNEFEEYGDYEDELRSVSSIIYEFPEPPIALLVRNMETYDDIRSKLPENYGELEIHERKAAFDVVTARWFKRLLMRLFKKKK